MSRDHRPSAVDTGRPFRVADWTVRPDLNRLVRGEETIAIEPRVMQVLLCLASRPGEVWTRDALLEEVWADLVIQEEALTHAISRLRRAFGDAARDSRFIETIPKRGYRLIAPVTPEPEPVEPESAVATQGPEREGPIPQRPPVGGLHRPWAVAGAMLLLVVIFAALFLLGGDPAERGKRPVVAMLEGAPLTSYPGEESMAALSPDGTRVVFCWDEDSGEELDLFQKQGNAEAPVRLTDAPGRELWPRWSPTGDRLVFQREHPGGSTVVVMPSAGGRERPVFESPFRAGVRGVDWLPSGDRLILSVREAEGGPHSLNLLSLESGELTRLLPATNSHGGDQHPACAPVGERVAFVSSDVLGQRDLYCLDSLEGSARRLTFGEGQIRGLDWTPDGRSVVFSSGTAFAGEFRLWRVDVDSGERTWLPTRGGRAVYPSIAGRANVLVYADETYRRQVLRTPVDSESEPEPFARSSHSEYDAHYSPSGTRVAFVSTRTGQPEIFICNLDGEELRQVTTLGGPNPEFLQWSRDEKFIAYDLMDGARSAVHVTDIERGMTRPATSSTTDEILHSWSRDGEAIYLRALVNGEWRSMRASIETGELEEVLPYCTYMVAEELGGDSLLYVRAGSEAIWRTPRGSGEEQKVVELSGAILQCYWKLLDDGLYFYRRTEQGSELVAHDLGSGEFRPVCSVPRGNRGLLDVAPDGSWLLFDRVEYTETDLVRVEPFPVWSED